MMNVSPIIEKDLVNIANHPLPWASLEGKTILFVGINSFLLTYMVKLIFFLNKTVFKIPVKIKGIYRNPIRLKEQYGENVKNLILYKLTNISHDFIKEIGHSDIIIHGASPASPLDFMRFPLETVELNIFLTRYLLDYAVTYSSENFIYFSSSEIYGFSYADEQGIKENYVGGCNPLDLRSCYGESKRAAEMLCSIYYHSKEIPVKIIRPFHTYGPGMRLRDGRIFSDLIADIIEKKSLTLKTDGQDRRSFCYLADAVLAYFTILFNGKVNEAYNVGNPQAVTSMIDLAKMLNYLFPSSGIKISPKKSEGSVCIPNIEKIKELGWLPTIDLKEGFLRTVKSYEYN